MYLSDSDVLSQMWSESQVRIAVYAKGAASCYCEAYSVLLWGHQGRILCEGGGGGGGG